MAPSVEATKEDCTTIPSPSSSNHTGNDTYNSRGGDINNSKKPNLLFIMCDQWRRRALDLGKHNFGDEDVIASTPELKKWVEGCYTCNVEKNTTNTTDNKSFRNNTNNEKAENKNASMDGGDDNNNINAINFSNAYCIQSVCGPSRGAIFSGRDSWKTGLIGNGIELDEKYDTLGTILQKNGYRCGYFGKNHINADDQEEGWNNRPLHSDGENNENDGIEEGKRRHGFDQRWVMTNKHTPFAQEYFDDQIENGLKRLKLSLKEYECAEDMITEKAIEFIDDHVANHSDKPFAIVLSYAPPHTSNAHGNPGPRPHTDYWIPGQASGMNRGYGYVHLNANEKLFARFDDKDGTFTQLFSKGLKNRLPNIRNIQTDIKYNGEYSWDHCVPGYYAACKYIDERIGKVFRYLQQRENNLLKDTVVVFTADHGEQMGSHGAMTKGLWFQESANIPFIISYGNKLRTDINHKSEELINSIDIMPTILGLMKLPKPTDVDGVDHSEYLLGNVATTKQEEIYLHFDRGGYIAKKDVRLGWRRWMMIRDSQYGYTIANYLLYETQRKLGLYQSPAIKKEDFHDKHTDDNMKSGIVMYDMKKDPYQINPLYPIPSIQNRSMVSIMASLHEKLIIRMNYIVENTDPTPEEEHTGPAPETHPSENKFRFNELRFQEYYGHALLCNNWPELVIPDVQKIDIDKSSNFVTLLWKWKNPSIVYNLYNTAAGNKPDYACKVWMKQITVDENSKSRNDSIKEDDPNFDSWQQVDIVKGLCNECNYTKTMSFTTNALDLKSKNIIWLFAVQTFCNKSKVAGAISATFGTDGKMHPNELPGSDHHVAAADTTTTTTMTTSFAVKDDDSFSNNNAIYSPLCVRSSNDHDCVDGDYSKTGRNGTVGIKRLTRMMDDNQKNWKTVADKRMEKDIASHYGDCDSRGTAIDIYLSSFDENYNENNCIKKKSPEKSDPRKLTVRRRCIIYCVAVCFFTLVIVFFKFYILPQHFAQKPMVILAR